MPNISVLVAVYNALPYLDTCLKSLAGQTLRDIEIICIDDCSTDGSLSVLQQYAQDDPRFIVLQTPHNSGQAVARNLGLSHCRGEWIAFVDADDWIEADALERLTAAEADAALFRLRYAYPQENGHFNFTDYEIPEADYARHILPAINPIEAARRSISWRGIHGVFALKAELFKKFPYDTKHLSYTDDIVSTLQFLHCNKVVCTDAVYYYRQHAESVTHKPSVKRFNILLAKERLAELLLAESVPDGFHREAATQIWLWLIDCCMFYHHHAGQLSEADRNFALREMQRVWKTCNRNLISPALLHKFGYRHLGAWPLFRLQCWIYFTLRDLLGR